MSAIERSEPSPRTAAQREETVLLEWTMHLLREDPKRAWVIVGAMLLAAAIGFLFFFSFLFAALGALLVLTASAEFLLPIRYRLTTERAMASYGLAQLDLRWSKCKRILEGPGAFRLSPFAKESRLDGIRGITLRWAQDEEPASRDAVLQIIRERMESAREEQAGD